MTQPKYDPVEYPAHYNRSAPGKPTGPEPIDLIEAAGYGVGFCAGNVIKYVFRFQEKDGLQCLLKARWYMNRLIQLVEAIENETTDNGSRSSEPTPPS